MTNLFNKIESYFSDKKPFVCFSKPDNSKLTGYFQNDDYLHLISEFKTPGFVFAPFDDKKKSILIPFNTSEKLIENIDFSKLDFHSQPSKKISSNKKEHFSAVDKAILAIKNNNFDKVVISRQEILSFADFDVLRIFKNLLVTYPKAFVYVWFHPKVGLWFGATPETLVKIDKNSFTTMSLAGTQSYQKDKEIVWGSKEIEEQQLVTNFIVSQLKPISDNLIVKERETVKAGNLLHLQTKISGKIDFKNNSLTSLIRALHPTPAVCGLPRNVTKKFILDNENYDRTFYTGFLGEINPQEKTELFVNLRCMEIKDKQASIYVGGGITKDSIAKKEWEETVAKSNTMKQIL